MRHPRMEERITSAQRQCAGLRFVRGCMFWVMKQFTVKRERRMLRRSIRSLDGFSDNGCASSSSLIVGDASLCQIGLGCCVTDRRRANAITPDAMCTGRQRIHRSILFALSQRVIYECNERTLPLPTNILFRFRLSMYATLPMVRGEYPPGD